MMKQPDEAPSCPYVGLQPFYEADREFFFGRDVTSGLSVSTCSLRH